MAQDVDLGILVITGGKGGVEPKVGDDAGVDVLRVGGIVEAGVHGGEGADVAACAAAASDDAVGIDAEFAGVLLEPTDGAFRVSDANSLVRLAVGQLGALAFEHLILSRGADQPAAGEVGAGSTKLIQRATAPATPVKEDQPRDFRLRAVVIRREVDFHPPLLSARSFVDVGFAGRRLGRVARSRRFLPEEQGG